MLDGRVRLDVPLVSQQPGLALPKLEEERRPQGHEKSEVRVQVMFSLDLNDVLKMVHSHDSLAKVDEHANGSWGSQPLRVKL